MEKILLSGKTDHIHSIEQSKEAQYVILQNVPVASTIKTQLVPENDNQRGLIPTINTSLLLEAQNKIDALSGKGMKVFRLQALEKSESETVDVIKSAVIDIAWNGEIVLGPKDEYDVELSGLEGLATSSMITLPSRRTSDSFYIVNDRTFEAKENEMNVDVTDVDVLVFDKDSLPQTVSIIQNGQKVKFDKEILLLQQEDNFGVVGYDANNAPIYGTYKAVVLPVTGVSSVYFEDNSKKKEDMEFYTIQLPK